MYQTYEVIYDHIEISVLASVRPKLPNQYQQHLPCIKIMKYIIVIILMGNSVTLPTDEDFQKLRKAAEKVSMPTAPPGKVLEDVTEKLNTVSIPEG